MSSVTELLGEVVAWDMNGPEVKLSTVRAALDAAGIATDIPALRATTAFSRACKPIKKGALLKAHKKDKDIKRYQLDAINEGENAISYDYVATLALDTDTGRVTCGENYELGESLQASTQEQLETRTASDITKIVQQLFVKNADLFPLVPRKGVAYFVPDVHRDFTERVERFLQSVGGKLHRWPVPVGTPQGNASVQDAVKAGLDEMVAELQASVAAWEPGKTRPSTGEKALTRWEAIRYKVDAYATFLEAEREKLGESLEAARQQLARRINEIASVDDDDTDTDDEQMPKQDEQTPKQDLPVGDVRAAKSAGWDACEAGTLRGENPYDGIDELLRQAWNSGWDACYDLQADEDNSEAAA